MWKWCWCRLKSGGDLIFASNLPGDRVYGKVGVFLSNRCLFICLFVLFYCCVFYYFAFVIVVFVKIPPLLVERVGGECCDSFFLFVVVLMWLLRPSQTFSTCF